MLFFLVPFVMVYSAVAGETMNGMKLGDFGNFPETWKVVTVRYREDTGEMRVTYANPKAWKTLSEGKTVYPEGAMFAKIGVMTGVDPDFPSSRVPQDSKRFQFMVRSAKFKETGGWGYSLFRKDGTTFADDEKETILACYSCHQIVAHRGDVFSEIGGFDLKTSPKTSKSGNFLATSFSLVGSSTLPEEVRKITTIGEQDVYLYQGPANDHVFAGTIDEMKPSLLEKARLSGKGVFFVSQSSAHFVGVLPGTEVCEEGKKSWIFWQKTFVPAAPGAKADKPSVVRTQKCY